MEMEMEQSPQFKHANDNLKQRKKKARAYIADKKNKKDKKIYTLGGEIFNSVSHGITALTGLVILVICIVTAAAQNLGATAIIAVIVFGMSAFVGYTISTVYHALAINGGKRVMRVLDHCSIYFIIAGTYTPFSLIGIGGWVGWTLFGANWTLCALGTTLTAIDREKYKRFAFVCYLVMGWLAVFAIVPLVNGIGLGTSFWLLLSGGIAYTIGAIIFKQKGKYIHGVWHIFTMIGLILHFLSILAMML